MSNFLCTVIFGICHIVPRNSGKKITVDQGKVLKNRLYRLLRVLGATRYGLHKLFFLLDFLLFHSRDFTVWQNRYFGNCFTFNSGESTNESRETGKTGALDGTYIATVYYRYFSGGFRVGATGAPLKFDRLCLFFIQFCIRMLKNKAHIAR